MRSLCGFEQKGIALVTQGVPAPVLGDADRLTQVIANLLDNALRFTPPGSHVEVTVEHDAGDALLAVSDTGIGIASEDVRHVFKRFWRAEQSRSRRTGRPASARNRPRARPRPQRHRQRGRAGKQGERPSASASPSHGGTRARAASGP
ncbi:MAG: ATP-binding protein [Thermoleophilia bacterium]